MGGTFWISLEMSLDPFWRARISVGKVQNYYSVWHWVSSEIWAATNIFTLLFNSASRRDQRLALLSLSLWDPLVRLYLGERKERLLVCWASAYEEMFLLFQRAQCARWSVCYRHSMLNTRKCTYVRIKSVEIRALAKQGSKALRLYASCRHVFGQRRRRRRFPLYFHSTGKQRLPMHLSVPLMRSLSLYRKSRPTVTYLYPLSSNVSQRIHYRSNLT